MKKLIIGILVLAVIAVGVYMVLGRGGAGEQKAPPTTGQPATVLPPVKASNTVVAEAKVVPVQRAMLSFPVNGVVAQVCAAEGDRVEAGQVLIRLDGTRQKTAVAKASAELNRAQARLSELKAGNREQQIEEARAALADTELRAPFDGTVASVKVHPGEYATPGNVVLWLADLSTWEIETDDLSELNVLNIQEGNPVTIKFDAIPGLELAEARPPKT